MRDVEPVVPPEGEEEVVAGDAGDLLRLEAEQLPDAVVLVDDVVADPQVGERGERPTEPRVGARRPLAEDLRVGQQDEAELAPDEPAPRRRDREAHAGVARQRAPSGRIVLSTLRSSAPWRCASPRCGNVTTTRLPGADEPEQLVLGLGEAARRDRRPLRLELERLPARERIELGGAVERDRRQALLVPDRAHLVRLPDEIGWAVDGRDQVARVDDPGFGVVLPAVRPLRVDALAAPLGGGVI